MLLNCVGTWIWYSMEEFMLLFTMVLLFGSKWACLEDYQFHIASSREKPWRDLFSEVHKTEHCMYSGNFSYWKRLLIAAVCSCSSVIVCILLCMFSGVSTLMAELQHVTIQIIKMNCIIQQKSPVMACSFLPFRQPQRRKNLTASKITISSLLRHSAPLCNFSQMKNLCNSSEDGDD